MLGIRKLRHTEKKEDCFINISTNGAYYPEAEGKLLKINDDEVRSYLDKVGGRRKHQGVPQCPAQRRNWRACVRRRSMPIEHLEPHLGMCEKFLTLTENCKLYSICIKVQIAIYI